MSVTARESGELETERGYNIETFWNNFDMFCTAGRILYRIYHKLLIPVIRKQERARKTWSECVKTDVSKCGLAGIVPQDRDAWITGDRHGLALPTPCNGTRAAL